MKCVLTLEWMRWDLDCLWDRWTADVAAAVVVVASETDASVLDATATSAAADYYDDGRRRTCAHCRR